MGRRTCTGSLIAKSPFVLLFVLSFPVIGKTLPNHYLACVSKSGSSEMLAVKLADYNLMFSALRLHIGFPVAVVRLNVKRHCIAFDIAIGNEQHGLPLPFRVECKRDIVTLDSQILEGKFLSLRL